MRPCMGRAAGVGLLFAAADEDDAAIGAVGRRRRGLLLRKLGPCLRQRSERKRKRNDQRAAQRSACVRGIDRNCGHGVLPVGEQTITIDRHCDGKSHRLSMSTRFDEGY